MIRVQLNITKWVDLKCDLREFFDMISDGDFSHENKKYGIRDMRLSKDIRTGIKCDLDVLEK